MIELWKVYRFREITLCVVPGRPYIKEKYSVVMAANTIRCADCEHFDDIGELYKHIATCKERLRRLL